MKASRRFCVRLVDKRDFCKIVLLTASFVIKVSDLNCHSEGGNHSKERVAACIGSPCKE